MATSRTTRVARKKISDPAVRRKKTTQVSSRALPARRVVKKQPHIKPSIVAQEKAIRDAWRFHPYRSFVEGLPAWLAILTLYMFAVIYLQSWTVALLFTLIIIVMVALLFDVLHSLNRHLRIPAKQIALYDRWLTCFGRGLLVGFSVCFLILFVLFTFTYQDSSATIFMLGSTFTLIGIGLMFFFMVSYIALIIFLGFPRIRHQLSLASLLFFCYFYLFFAFAVRRVAV